MWGAPSLGLLQKAKPRRHAHGKSTGLDVGRVAPSLVKATAKQVGVQLNPWPWPTSKHELHKVAPKVKSHGHVVHLGGRRTWPVQWDQDGRS